MHPASLQSVAVEDGALAVAWADGTRFAFHPIWLRERAPEAETLDARTGQRKLEAAFLPLDLTVDRARRAGEAIEVGFSDGGAARFEAAALRRALAPRAQVDLLGDKQLWDGTLGGFPCYRLGDLKQGRPLLGLLDDLARFGCVLIEEVPPEKNGILEFMGLIGNIKLTNWGGVEDVKVDADAFDLTLTNRGLEPHVDNPYRFSTIGYVVLHCLENSFEGGDSTIVDGFAVAERLRREDPAAFEVLATTPVYFRYEDETTLLDNVRSLIGLDAEGRVERVAWSNRTEFVDARPAAELARYYAARQRFAELLYGEEMTVTFKLQPGQAFILDNYRVLHGRRPFELAGGGNRHMRQGYFDRDMVSSRQKVLRREFAHD